MRGLPILLLAVLAGCRAAAHVDLKLEEAELLRLHRMDREAHFQTSADSLLSRHPAEGMLSVSNGRINRAALAQQRAEVEAYLRGAKYFEWEDLEPPIVRISADGSMAWMIIRLRVRRVQPDTLGVDQPQQFTYAGITTYEKREGRWTRVANVSTFE